MGKEELLKRLRAAGAERVEAQYDGYSDEGLLFEVELYGPDGATVPGPDDGLWRDIEEVVCDLLSRQWPGWEINDGSIGGHGPSRGGARHPLHRDRLRLV